MHAWPLALRKWFDSIIAAFSNERQMMFKFKLTYKTTYSYKLLAPGFQEAVLLALMCEKNDNIVQYTISRGDDVVDSELLEREVGVHSSNFSKLSIHSYNPREKKVRVI